MRGLLLGLALIGCSAADPLTPAATEHEEGGTAGQIVNATGGSVNDAGSSANTGGGTPTGCDPGAIECVHLSGSVVVRECPVDGSGWVTYSCPEGQVCVETIGCRSAAAGSGGALATGGAAGYDSAGSGGDAGASGEGGLVATGGAAGESGAGGQGGTAPVEWRSSRLDHDYCCGLSETPYGWAYPRDEAPDAACVLATFQLPDWQAPDTWSHYTAWCCPHACIPAPLNVLSPGTCTGATPMGYACYGEHPDILIPPECTQARNWSSGLCCSTGLGENIGAQSTHVDLGEHCTDPWTQPGCPTWQQRCGDECIEVRTNAENCGRCGYKCTTGDYPICCDGACINGVSNENCGSCGWTCSEGFECKLSGGSDPRPQCSG
jgi:hypothetical protein